MLRQINDLRAKLRAGKIAPVHPTAALVNKLARLPLLESMEPRLLEAIATEFDWFSLPGGQILFNHGDQDDSLYVVLSGRLGAFLHNDEGKEILIRQMVSGETVGEMALLSGESRSATVLALRDTELARLSKSSFEKLVGQHPKALRFVTDLLVRRLREPPRLDGPKLAPRTVAIFPLVPELASCDFARSFAKAFEEMGLKAATLDHSCVEQPIEWFNKLEEAHDIVLYQADFESSPWTGLCLRHADRLLLLADAARPPSAASTATDKVINNPRRAPVELVVLGNERSAGPLPTMSLLARYDVVMHHHVRRGVSRDLRRVARLITGRAIGVVLSGGGARGFAHIGVIRALREAGLKLDLFGGASMGAIVAAGAAMEWDDQVLSEHMRAAFSDANPVSDYTLPVIALVKGRKASRAFREHFGNQQIEDLVYPFFCLSVNLSTSRINVHRTGPLWLALRASTSIPGVLPPVIEGTHIFIDGGIMNNLPIDVMSEMRRGPMIAVDVTHDYNLVATIDDIDQRSIWQLFGHARHGTPNILTVLMAAGTVSSSAQVRTLRNRVDLLLEPQLDGISMLNWKAFDRAVESGYRHTIEALEKNRGTLFQAPGLSRPA